MIIICWHVGQESCVMENISKKRYEPRQTGISKKRPASKESFDNMVAHLHLFEKSYSGY